MAEIAAENVASENGRADLVSTMMTGPDGAGSPDGLLNRALQSIRSHLGMEVAYVSQFVDNQSVFREVDAPGLEAIIKPGDSRSLDDVYCRHILEGRLPELIRDTADEPICVAMPITKAASIGRHMSVPIRLKDGTPYGMFCCLGFAPDPSLQQRDLQMMRAFADLAAHEINRERDAAVLVEEKRRRIMAVIDERQISIVFQPIWSVETQRPVGVECLSRFSATPSRSPDKWFNEAAEAGLGSVLELAAIQMALASLPLFPADTYLAVNASPETILAGDLTRMLEPLPLERIVLEITEHAPVDDYDRLLAAIRPLRERGVRLAVDDAGAGYSGLQHILQLQPDLIKLDMALTRHIDLDPARRALAAALIAFANDTNSAIIAEGVETESELRTLASLGIGRAQGYFLGKPMSLEAATALFAQIAPPAVAVA